MEEENKVQYEALMRQAEFNIARFDARREYSWKISLAFWAAIFGSSVALKGEIVQLSRDIAFVSILFGALGGGVFLHGYWLKNVFDADQKDKELAFGFRDLAIELLNTNIKPPPKNERKCFLQDWSARFQLGTTVFLTSALCIYLLI